MEAASDEELLRRGARPGGRQAFAVLVCRHHARLTRTRTGEFVVHDIGSLNGTYVNRRRVEDAVVRTGDELQVGRFKLVLFIAGE